jgi:hypothetical protein
VGSRNTKELLGQPGCLTALFCGLQVDGWWTIGKEFAWRRKEGKAGSFYLSFDKAMVQLL